MVQSEKCRRLLASQCISSGPGRFSLYSCLLSVCFKSPCCLSSVCLSHFLSSGLCGEEGHRSLSFYAWLRINTKLSNILFVINFSCLTISLVHNAYLAYGYSHSRQRRVQLRCGNRLTPEAVWFIRRACLAENSAQMMNIQQSFEYQLLYNRDGQSSSCQWADWRLCNRTKKTSQELSKNCVILQPGELF